ncbi:hypothetical protein Cs7R123_57700 [Catellatospora sp. TT07R-123]|uniref:hypothetical protein n=1 Tax=Catellatospora sp. TT07R-123 TaxID=2733863 RepID=UPI001B19526A|nr:hypothetical protein [Catellatospora sp. TT07R-123]GHJ48428.1 hypothetical protein Cs7R123_57700 [Catellatospora sp. TT07R-123]
MSVCPHCGTPTHSVVSDPATGTSGVLSNTSGVHDPGGCLVIFLLTFGTTVAITAANWLGSLVGLHLWHWMTSPWPSIPTMARTVLVIGLTMLLLVLAMRKWITRRFPGPHLICETCHKAIPTVASSVGRGGKRALGALLVVIFVCLGYCGLAVDTEDPAAEPVAACGFGDSDRLACTSPNPVLSIYQKGNPGGKACRFTETVDWGDGSRPATATVDGAAAQTRLVAKHTYRTAARYGVRISTKAGKDGCAGLAGSYTFTYAP